MRDSPLRALLTIILALALTALGAGALPDARAADCGNGVSPCHCGDRVVTNTRLGGSDPVLKTVCPCEGLIVASGVSLEIRGTITGVNELCSGIILEGHATGVAVTNGRIAGFGLGVDGDTLGPASGNRFANLQISGGFAGFLLTGDANVVERSIVRDAFVAGVLVIGNGNTVRVTRAEGAALYGVSVIGDGSTVSRNAALRNSGDGIALAGKNVTVDLNRAEYNGGAGFVLEGSGLTVSRNLAAGNALDGLAVSASASTLDRNRGDYNRLFGLEEIGDIQPPNIYLNNRCTGNDLGASTPPGLCR